MNMTNNAFLFMYPGTHFATNRLDPRAEFFYGQTPADTFFSAEIRLAKFFSS